MGCPILDPMPYLRFRLLTNPKQIGHPLTQLPHGNLANIVHRGSSGQETHAVQSEHVCYRAGHAALLSKAFTATRPAILSVLHWHQIQRTIKQQDCAMLESRVASQFQHPSLRVFRWLVPAAYAVSHKRHGRCVPHARIA